jgi:multicomponent Na+:H+ antiporter subunit F
MDIFLIVALILVFTAFLCLYRGIRGPDVFNRIIAINVIGTKTVVVLGLVGFIYGRPAFLDISLVYALLSFMMTLAFSKYIERGGLSE